MLLDNMSVPKIHQTSGFAASSLTSFVQPALSKLLWGFALVFATTYFLFQKKLLPFPVMKIVSKMLFMPTFPITAMLRIGNYWTVVDDTLILGCAPMAILNHPSSLYKLGVRGVVNMCYEYEGPKAAYSKLGIKQLHLPNVDHFEVPVEDLKDAVEFIRQHKDRGEKVYVHCKAGHGRAASIALSWLIHENRGISAKVKSLSTMLSSTFLCIYTMTGSKRGIS